MSPPNLMDENPQLVLSLFQVIANTATLKIKAQNNHWNATSLAFQGLHILFQDIYEDLEKALDTLTEDALGLGLVVPASLEDYLDLATIKGYRGYLHINTRLEVFLEDQIEMQKLLRYCNQYAEASNLIGVAATLQERDRAHGIYIYKLRKTLE